MTSTAEIVQAIIDIVWSPALVVLLIAGGLYFTIRTRFVQIRCLKDMVKILIHGGNDAHKGISSFESFCLTVSGRVGSGNIIGVAMAIAFGGPGALFWMWVIAFFGAATAFMESTLSNKYREVYSGGWIGGPASYITNGLKSKGLGLTFAFLAVISYGFLVVPLQSNSISNTFFEAFSVPPLVSGIALGVLVLVVILGGAKRIAHVATVIGPFMAIAFITLTLIVIAVYFNRLPAVFAAIFKGAFGFDSAFGGIIGSTISMGVKRGLFSNEAGQGTGAIVSASADVDHPVKQGLIQSLSVYIDTIVVCTATGLMILCSGCYNVFDQATGEALEMNVPELGNNFVYFSQAAIDSVIPHFGGGIIAISLAFFVYSSLIACFFYCSSSIKYFCIHANLSAKVDKIACRICMFGMFVVIVLGSVAAPGVVWQIGDIGVGLTTWINVIALIILCPQVVALLKDYESKKKQ